MTLKPTVAALVLAVMLATPVRAAPPPEMEYAYPDQSVWTAETDARGIPLNPLLRLARALFAEAGIAWHPTPYPAARMFALLRSGAAQFSMLVAAPGLAECCVVSRAPVARTEIRVFWRAATPAVATPADLMGKSLVVIRGYSYGALAGLLADGGATAGRITVDGHRAAFQMLEHGRGDYVLDYAGPAEEMLTARPIADIRWARLADVNVHMVLSRAYPDAEAVMARLEAVAARLDKDRLMRGP